MVMIYFEHGEGTDHEPMEVGLTYEFIRQFCQLKFSCGSVVAADRWHNNALVICTENQPFYKYLSITNFILSMIKPDKNTDQE